jgi:GT2 family glycosyltransferase
VNPPPTRVSAVVITRDRVDELLRCIDRLPRDELARVIVVDNGSVDGSAAALRRRHADVELIALVRNHGAYARNIAVALCDTPYVCFVDDDSGWQPGSVTLASRILDAHPRVAAVNARILLDRGDEDPVCGAMARSPLGRSSAGMRLLGFVACAAVVRRDPFLAAGGFQRRLGVGGEEELLALDLAAAGWDIVYAPDVVARHHPSPHRDAGARRRRVLRNRLLVAWLRRPLAVAARASVQESFGAAQRDIRSLTGLTDALRELRWVRRARRVNPEHVEQALARLARS